MVSYTDQARDAILRDADNQIRARRSPGRPSADANGRDRCLPGSSKPAAAAPISRDPVTSTADPVAAAVPSRMQREIAELELADLERAAETARRRQIEQRVRDQRSASAEVAGLRGEVVELGKAANVFAEAIGDRVEAMAAEISDLKAKLATAMARIDDLVAARGVATLLPPDSPDELPKFLKPRLAS
jgi:hypothetical protein